MGQTRWADSGGSQGFSGQTKGQNMKCGRRGVERNKDGVVGPTEVATMSHQRWWCDGVSADAGYYPSPASVFEGVWGPVHNYQK